MPLYAEDFEQPCNAPGCTENYGDRWLHSQCHVEHPTWALVQDDILTVVCARCYQPIVQVAIAKRPQGVLPKEPPKGSPKRPK